MHGRAPSPLQRVESDEDDMDIAGLQSVSGGESRSGQLTGTKALMLAVLEDGIRCYLSNKKRLQREAETWMYCSRRLVFSFTVLCETFGLDPNATRAALRRMRKEASGLGSLRHRGRQNVRHNVISLA